MHSMRDKGQSAEQAAGMRDAFIEANMLHAMCAESQGDHRGAMRSLSRAMHAVMDGTSPALVDASGDPRVWRIRDTRQHNAAETGQPTAEQQASMSQRLRDMYDRVMAQRANK
jgi:hypothetical protein